MKFSSLAISVMLLVTGTALKINVPSSLIIGQPTEITWENQPNDRMPWILFLMNASDIFGLKGIIDNIPYEDQHLTWTIPSDVPPYDKYALKAVNASNVDMVFTQSPLFALGN